jgi:hypothetical protein
MFSRKPTVKAKQPKEKPGSFKLSQKKPGSGADISDLDEDNHRLSEEDIKKHEEAQNRRAFTYLSGDAVRWMQKRKPKASSSASSFIPPQRVLQLRSIFRGLDFDGSGEIDITELKDAVKYVAQADAGGGKPMIENPDEIVSLFESMDIDGNGSVDFDEFLLGMTSSGAGNVSGKMANAFFDFANQHRRQQIVDKINDTKSDPLSRYDELRKLYNMQYLKAEPREGEIFLPPYALSLGLGLGLVYDYCYHMNAPPNTLNQFCLSLLSIYSTNPNPNPNYTPGTIKEIMEKIYTEAKQQKKEMSAAAEKYRKAELSRARAAAIYFDQITPGKGKGQGQITHGNKIGLKALTSALKNLTGDEKEDDAIFQKVNKKVQNNLCRFSIDGPSDTYMPPLAIKSGGMAKLSTKVHDQAVLVRNDSFTRSNILAPPLSISKQRLSRVESSHSLHMEEQRKLMQKDVLLKERKISGVALANYRRATMGNQTTSVKHRRASVSIQSLKK